jgi:hypothetical protein
MNVCRVWPHLMRLVESGSLISVAPTTLSSEIFTKADAHKRETYGKDMHPGTCEPNARALVEAMQAEKGWAVVGGFAVGPIPQYPTRHVWVRKGDAHFDPTWSLNIVSTVPTITYTMVPVAEYYYFALPGMFPEGEVLGRKGLNYLSEIAAELGIELLEDHLFDIRT